MVRLGEYLCGLLLVLVMAPVLALGFIIATFDVGHYLRNRQM